MLSVVECAVDSLGNSWWLKCWISRWCACTNNNIIFASVRQMLVQVWKIINKLLLAVRQQNCKHQRNWRCSTVYNTSRRLTTEFRVVEESSRTHRDFHTSSPTPSSSWEFIKFFSQFSCLGSLTPAKSWERNVDTCGTLRAVPGSLRWLIFSQELYLRPLRWTLTLPVLIC